MPADRSSSNHQTNPERIRLREDALRLRNWKRWGPYLAERQWGTVREDYSPDGDCWASFPHEHARSRAYRWGEDGICGICDREGRLCFAVALWNGRDPILKERLFGLTNPEGNHGEDVKEEYFYIDSTPTHSYMRAMYKYPQAEFPYQALLDENRRRTRVQPEYELADTGVFAENRAFDVQAEYAKAGPDDVLIRITVTNRGPDAAPLHLLPTLWFRNTWVWGCKHDGCWMKPYMGLAKEQPKDSIKLEAEHESLGKINFFIEPASDGTRPELLFTENHTNNERLYNVPSVSKYVKDAFHERVIQNREDAVNPKHIGSKAAGWFKLNVPAGKSVTVRCRLIGHEQPGDPPRAPTAQPQQRSPDPDMPSELFGNSFEQVFRDRQAEADHFYATGKIGDGGEDDHRIVRQAHGGLLWSKQFYHYIVADWLDGDPNQPPPPPPRKGPAGRNIDWRHVHARDVISMPDKWEYPWFAAWDLAFHCVALSQVDPEFAKNQLILMMREWYMHASGELPAYEFNFGDVNPPVHAWACWRVYKMTGKHGGTGEEARDRAFLARCFHKLLLNFTWWVNRKDIKGKHIFAGGFLGLDNIGVFDRSRPLPMGGMLEQADGTAWMAFFCGTMLSMALELASADPAYEDVASKFFEHFVAIADAMNGAEQASGSIASPTPHAVNPTAGLWDPEDGFYYDKLIPPDHGTAQRMPLRVRSLVGLIPLLAVEVLEERVINQLPGFKKRMTWFIENRKDLAASISYLGIAGEPGHEHRLLAIPSKDRLLSLLKYMLDENEFLSPFGIRSLSKYHQDHPYIFRSADPNDPREYHVSYAPAESLTSSFGGNSNWRGPIWFPINYLIIEALERYHHFYGENVTVDCPEGTGKRLPLDKVAQLLRQRLVGIFRPRDGRRPCMGEEVRYTNGSPDHNLILFHEYFNPETGKGLGASHQTGWTALVALMLRDVARNHPYEHHS